MSVSGCLDVTFPFAAGAVLTIPLHWSEKAPRTNFNRNCVTAITKAYCLVHLWASSDAHWSLLRWECGTWSSCQCPIIGAGDYCVRVGERVGR